MSANHPEGKTTIKSIEELYDYLQKAGDRKMHFRAYPISGQPEDFLYDGSEKLVIRIKDNRYFDNLEDFVCYCFQCDQEGYSHTEHIQVESL